MGNRKVAVRGWWRVGAWGGVGTLSVSVIFKYKLYLLNMQKSSLKRMNFTSQVAQW